jgi:hypothetical protein
MTERTMSPTAAQAHAKRIVRSRFKAIRLGKRVESPHILAGRLIVLLEDAARDNPGPWSAEWAEYVLHHAGQQYERLCEVAPIREQVSA